MQEFTLRDDQGNYLVERTASRGSAAGIGRIWSEEASRALRFGSHAEAEHALASEFQDFERKEIRIEAVSSSIPPAPSKRAKIVRAVDVESHGVDNSQYFQGAGVAFTDFDDCATGVGNSEREALADALESLAQSGEWEFRPELGFPPEPSEEDYSDTDSVSEVLAEYAPRIPAPLFEIVRLPPDGSGPYSLLAPTDSLAQAFEHLRVRLAAFARSGYTIENVSERSEPAIRPDSDPDTLEFNSDGDVRAFELQSPEDGSGGDYLLLRLANLREREDFARELERYEENSELYYYVTVRVAQAPEGSERSDGLTEYEDSQGREWAYAPDFETASSAAEAQARESAWAFRLEFLAPFLPENVREPRILEALAKAQEKLSESFGPILEALLGDKLADAMREAVRADGMGAFLAHFDGETVSDSDGAQRFRLN